MIQETSCTVQAGEVAGGGSTSQKFGIPRIRMIVVTSRQRHARERMCFATTAPHKFLMGSFVAMPKFACNIGVQRRRGDSWEKRYCFHCSVFRSACFSVRLILCGGNLPGMIQDLLGGTVRWNSVPPMRTLSLSGWILCRQLKELLHCSLVVAPVGQKYITTTSARGQYCIDVFIEEQPMIKANTEQPELCGAFYGFRKESDTSEVFYIDTFFGTIKVIVTVFVPEVHVPFFGPYLNGTQIFIYHVDSVPIIPARVP